MDIEGLLRSLNDHNVEYVVIGATAFPIHGYARATLDVDVFIRATPENARRTRDALNTFGYDLSDVTEEDLLTKPLKIENGYAYPPEGPGLGVEVDLSVLERWQRNKPPMAAE